MSDALRGSVATGVQVAQRLRIAGLFDAVRSAFVAMDTTLWCAAGSPRSPPCWQRPSRGRTASGPSRRGPTVLEVS